MSNDKPKDFLVWGKLQLSAVSLAVNQKAWLWRGFHGDIFVHWRKSLDLFIVIFLSSEKRVQYCFKSWPLLTLHEIMDVVVLQYNSKEPWTWVNLKPSDRPHLKFGFSSVSTPWKLHVLWTLKRTPPRRLCTNNFNTFLNKIRFILPFDYVVLHSL